ncbi:MAG: hypothetical protein NWR73_06135 [Flavobacteriales bacterium]|nr:hypothetical protein [Flavobacteriales bacterium]
MNRPIIFLAFTAVLFSCKHEIPFDQIVNNPYPVNPVVPDPCDPDSIYFQEQILPLFISSCGMPDAGCHDPIDHEEGIVLTSYNQIINTGDIVGGNLNAGDIFDVITTNNNNDRMPPPPNAPLTQEQIDMIATWILQGAENNSCESLFCDTLNVTFSNSISTLVSNKCEGCHSGANPNGGVSLTNYAQISASATSGTLWDAINATNGVAIMPPNTGLSDCEIATFRIWIENGALND